MSNVNKIDLSATQPQEPALTEDQARRADFDRQLQEIKDWWATHAQAAADRTAPKAVQYGAADLDLMGQAMVSMVNGKLAGATDAERIQYGRYAACAFYALGKVARIFGALEQGILPDPDSEFDLEVYAIMMARIRETGGWVQ